MDNVGEIIGKAVQDEEGQNEEGQEENSWTNNLVGFVSDGAAVMVGRNAGVSTKLREICPWLINIQCLAHGLELAAQDTLKEHDGIYAISELMRGLYKQYHYSPKVDLIYLTNENID